MISTLLVDNWRFCIAGEDPGYMRPQTQDLGWLKAEVPGYVHTDLMRHRVIGDPFVEKQELGCRWVDERDWIYECTFDWSARDGLPNRALVFEGLDTVADVYLNGQMIGSFDNMFLKHELNVSDLLADGENTLRIYFHSAVRVGDERRSKYFAENGIAKETAWFDERAFIRKAGCMSGWDWGPRLVSCGIWKPIELIEYESRIQSVSAGQTYVGGGRFQVDVQVDVEGAGEVEVFWNGSPVERSFETADAIWWPNGEGDAVLHDLEVRLGEQVVKKKVGLRTIELRRQPDEVGTSFEFMVNGWPVWSRGANWIPHDTFLTRVNREDIFASIERYRKLGMNMLRVWGGGVYESEDFYDACDAAGIMVWQDFPYACSYYPDGEAEQKRAYEEAVTEIKRLKGRTSLALWCGNNENRALWSGKWGGVETAPDRFYGEVIYDEVLKRAVADTDPSRTYVESSPLLVNGLVPETLMPAQLHSDDHYWDVWHGQGDWVHYHDSKTRFSSEFGFASSCSRDAWGLVSDRDMSIEDASVDWHNKTSKTSEEFQAYVEIHYPKSESLDDWIYYSQLNQRDAMRCAIEHYRSNPACRGALIWQINDCWPVQSWALEDSARRLKPAGFELIRLYAPVLIGANLVDQEVQITVCNDSANELRDTAVVEFMDGWGEVLGQSKLEVCLAGNEREMQSVPLLCGAKIARITLKSGVCPDRHLLVDEPKDYQFEAVPLQATCDGETLVVRCPGYVHDLAIWNDSSADKCVVESDGIVGLRPYTGRDLTLKFNVGECGRLRARSLAGEHEICFE